MKRLLVSIVLLSGYVATLSQQGQEIQLVQEKYVRYGFGAFPTIKGSRWCNSHEKT